MKCDYLWPELEYLGHLITAEGITPNPDRIIKVGNYPEPKNAKEAKQLLGLVGYYRKFVKNFSAIAKPLTRLLKENVPFEFGQTEKFAFDKLKIVSLRLLS